MDWQTIILTLIGSLASVGGLGGLFMAKENKRAKRIENDRSAAAEWKELYERSEAKVNDQSAKIDALYKEIGEQRRLRAEAESRLSVSRLLECRKTPCVDRDPPLGSYLIEKQ